MEADEFAAGGDREGVGERGSEDAGGQVRDLAGGGGLYDGCGGYGYLVLRGGDEPRTRVSRPDAAIEIGAVAGGAAVDEEIGRGSCGEEERGGHGEDEESSHRNRDPLLFLIPSLSISRRPERVDKRTEIDWGLNLLTM